MKRHSRSISALNTDEQSKCPIMTPLLDWGLDISAILTYATLPKG